MTIAGVDLFIIIIYLLSIVGLGCWVGIRNKKQQADGYFLAGKSLRWPVIGLALFATNISTVHLVSLAEEGYTNGLAYGNFEWMAPFLLIFLALFFAPFYLMSQFATLPDFTQKSLFPCLYRLKNLINQSSRRTNISICRNTPIQEQTALTLFPVILTSSVWNNEIGTAVS